MGASELGLVLVLAWLNGPCVAMQRSWLGPAQLIQGSPPTPRDSFGFTSVSGKIFVYGGIGDTIG